jgi:hypothetical protein
MLHAALQNMSATVTVFFLRLHDHSCIGLHAACIGISRPAACSSARLSTNSSQTAADSSPDTALAFCQFIGVG